MFLQTSLSHKFGLKVVSKKCAIPNNCVLHCLIFYKAGGSRQNVSVYGLGSLILACWRASVRNHLASDCEQNWETWCALELICPDRTRAFNLFGGGRGLNSLLTSSSGRGSSPRATRAVLSCCRFCRNRVLSWHCLTARFWDLLNFIDS